MVTVQDLLEAYDLGRMADRSKCTDVAVTEMTIAYDEARRELADAQATLRTAIVDRDRAFAERDELYCDVANAVAARAAAEQKLAAQASFIEAATLRRVMAMFAEDNLSAYYAVARLATERGVEIGGDT